MDLYKHFGFIEMVLERVQFRSYFVRAYLIVDTPLGSFEGLPSAGLLLASRLRVPRQETDSPAMQAADSFFCAVVALVHLEKPRTF